MVGKDDVSSNNAPINNLARALLENHEPKFVAAEDSLQDLTAKQDMLMGQVFRQTDRLSEAIKHTQVYEMVTQTKIYQNKLLSLQKEMADLSERSQKIKKRALKLQQSKQHEALLREQAKDRELEREKQLIARPAKRN
ncbi:biogenesis of lysosome-related organelles complex 1 subunit 6-like [Daphnia pulex]|uniref:biogenesis of lysosome-related organelles complex 1 subunit 6-like n=1 Tax=Daphnia pulex TaxID=6669 RepID=UPI001EDFB76C|nr:biogenesis of lysosome-related organelles complex 1 subunit 6-like [Daphnia pulex]